VEGALAPEADVTRGLYEQYANQIFRYCLHQLGSREEAEDAVQSTFLNAFRGIKRGIVPELESAWLFKIAHNVCLSRRRSAWRRGRVESPADFEVVEDLTPAPARRSDELIGLQDVLEQMPEAQRRAILLREWQGLSYREIADELELSQAAVETLIFRARRSLATGLEQPPETKRRRVARALDFGNVAAGIQSLLVGGGAAVKVAATVAVVSATTVVAAQPVQQHQRHHVAPVPAPAAVHPQRVVAKRVAPLAHVTAPIAAVPSAATRVAAPVRRHASAAAARTHAQAVSTAAPAASAPVLEQPTAPVVAQPAPTPAPPAAQPTEPAPAASQPADKSDHKQAKQEDQTQRRFDRTAQQPQPADAPQQPDQGSQGNGNAAPPNDNGNKNGFRKTNAVPISTDPVVVGQPVAVSDQPGAVTAPAAPTVSTAAPVAVDTQTADLGRKGRDKGAGGGDGN
jgi:RNA polymerase sigma factor (sigma-70 family)